jgi:hypothetical protein
MTITTLTSPDDLKWLQDVHNVPATNFPVAVVYGNEDAPDKVELYAQNNCNCDPEVYTQDPQGNLIKEAS